jgi:hypothetical protein
MLSPVFNVSNGPVEEDLHDSVRQGRGEKIRFQTCIFGDW